MLGWFLNKSAVVALAIRQGNSGRWRWIGYDASGSARTVTTHAVGWDAPEEAEHDGLALFPRAVIKREERKCKSSPSSTEAEKHGSS